MTFTSASIILISHSATSKSIGTWELIPITIRLVINRVTIKTKAHQIICEHNIDGTYKSTRKGQSLEVFDTAYEAKQHLNFNPELPSGVEGLRPVHVSIVDHDVLQIVYAYHELLKGNYFDRVDDMPKYIKYRVSTLSGNIAGDYKEYLPQKTDVINGMTITYRMVDDAVYLAFWEHAGQNHVFLFNDPVSVTWVREMINSVGTN